MDESTLELKPALREWFPEWLLPALGEPEAAPAPFFTPEQMSAIPSFEAWLEAYRGSDRQ